MRICVFDGEGRAVRLLDCPDGLLAWDSIAGLPAPAQARILDGTPWADVGILVRPVAQDGAVVWVSSLPSLSEFDAATAA